jgi:hypothetical protein
MLLTVAEVLDLFSKRLFALVADHFAYLLTAFEMMPGHTIKLSC